MERFKALEKEMKMKAFSKEGLIAQSRLDPAEKAKREMIDWIGNTTDELSRQIEATEAEAEALQTGKKKNKASGDKLHGLEELNERRQWHIGRLEVVQRMLENGQLSTDLVEAIQEDVKYFVESNAVSCLQLNVCQTDTPGRGLRLRYWHLRRAQSARRGGLSAGRLFAQRRSVQPRFGIGAGFGRRTKDTGKRGEGKKIYTGKTGSSIYYRRDATQSGSVEEDHLEKDHPGQYESRAGQASCQTRRSNPACPSYPCGSRNCAYAQNGRSPSYPLCRRRCRCRCPGSLIVFITYRPCTSSVLGHCHLA